VAGYVWLRWRQYSKELEILAPGETYDIERADAELRESGYRQQSTRSQRLVAWVDLWPATPLLLT
jgi:hypothetical protein